MIREKTEDCITNRGTRGDEGAAILNMDSLGSLRQHRLFKFLLKANPSSGDPDVIHSQRGIYSGQSVLD